MTERVSSMDSARRAAIRARQTQVKRQYRAGLGESAATLIFADVPDLLAALDQAEMHAEGYRLRAEGLVKDWEAMKERAETAEAENARLRDAVVALTEQASSWLAQFTDEDGNFWNLAWQGGGAREMHAAIEQSRAALGAVAPEEATANEPH